MTIQFYAGVQFRWFMYFEDDLERENPLVYVPGLPCPREGDTVMHEEINGPLTVKKVIWHFRDGHPLKAEVLVQ